MHKFHDTLLGCIIAGLVATCVDPNLAGGGLDTETSGGTVAGMLVAEDGTPGKNAKVFCVPSSYNALRDPQLSDSLVTTTDEIGFYHFDRVKKGEYNIQAGSPDKKTNVLICGVKVAGDSITVQRSTLLPSAMLKIVFPDTVNYASGYCYLPGTTLFAPIQNGLAIVADVPTGFVPAANYFDALDSTKNHVIEDSFFISPDDTTVITDFTPWKYSKMVYLNTTATGANISGNVYDFPVLVRLTSSNFDFAGAKAGGSDLRFAKSDGDPVPFEIERWDPSVGQAEIWVKIDTVYGNDSTQSMTMYWGNIDAAGQFNSAAVFDTANGFQGVWHLAEADNKLPGGFKDATANAYNLTGATRTTEGHADGVIGGARKFGAVASDSIVGPCPDKLSGNSSFTVSFWIKVDTLLPSRPCILDFGTASYLTGGHFFVWPDYTAQFGIFDTGGFMKPSDPEPPHQNVFSVMNSAATWMYIVSVYDAGARTLTSYVNGTVMDRDTISAIRIDIAGGLHIGRPYASYYPGYFGGILDEVRILSIPESEERIRLSYVNESPDNTLVKFK